MNEQAKLLRVGAGCGGDYTMGVGSSGGSSYEAQPTVRQLIDLNAPTLALARARGQLAPWGLNIRGEFITHDTQVLPQQKAEDKLRADCFVRGVTYKILNTETANASSISAISDLAFQQQSGIEVTIENSYGAPGINPVPSYTPISALPCLLGSGWIMRWTELPYASMQNTIVLPFNVNVIITYNMFTPTTDCDEYRSNFQAITLLQTEFGIDFCASTPMQSAWGKR